MQKRDASTISLVMQRLNRAAVVPAALVDLISTVQTWEISSGDIFGDLFGGGGRRRANNGPMKGANLRARVNITFEEAVFGCDKGTGDRSEG